MARVPEPLEAAAVPQYDVSPRVTAPELTVRADPNAFSAVGRAVEHAGATLEGVGDKVFATAVEIQDLQNSNISRDASTSTQNQMVSPLTTYEASKGQDAVNNSGAVLKQMDDIYQKEYNALQDPKQKAQFANDMAPFRRSAAFRVAQHAASELKTWTLKSAEDASTVNQQNWNDPRNRQEEQDKEDAQARINEAYFKAAGITGDSPDAQSQRTLYRNQQHDKMVVAQARMLGITEPTAGLDLIERRGVYNDTLRTSTIEYLRGQNRQLGTSAIANIVYDPNKPVQQQIDEAHKLIEANPSFKDDPLFTGMTETKIRGHNTTQRFISTQEAHDAEIAIDNAIVQGRGSITTVEQLKDQHPELASMLDAHPEIAIRVPAKINSYLDSSQRPARNANYKTLLGWWNNDQAKFMNANLEEQNLTDPEYRDLLQKRQSLIKGQRSDPRVVSAMAAMRNAGMLPQGLETRSVSNEVEYDKITGAVQAAWQDWRDDNGKPPSQDEFLKYIAPHIINDEIVTPHWNNWFGRLTGAGRGTQPAYDALDQYVTEHIGDYNKTHPNEPPLSNYEYRQIVLRTMFKNLFKPAQAGGGGESVAPKSTTTTTTPSGNQPGAVPKIPDRLGQ